MGSLRIRHGPFQSFSIGLSLRNQGGFMELRKEICDCVVSCGKVRLTLVKGYDVQFTVSFNITGMNNWEIGKVETSAPGY